MLEEELPPEDLNANQELDEQEQQEQKKEATKKSLKAIVGSATCLLLFIIILLLLLLLGLKKCTNNVSSSSSEEAPVEIYDNKKLNNVFKDIIKNHAKIEHDVDINPEQIIAVTYVDDYPNTFDLSISAVADDKVYYFSLIGCDYQINIIGYDNLITYLLHEGQDCIFMGEGQGPGFVLNMEIEDKNTTEVINVNKPESHFITSKSPANIKHISGYYMQDNKFYVYQRLEYSDNNNPLVNNEGILIDDSSLLYGYYFRGNAKLL